VDPQFFSWSPIGGRLMRFPVAAWIALATAGAIGDTPCIRRFQINQDARNGGGKVRKSHVTVT
jgi:hypothetical protein